MNGTDALVTIRFIAADGRETAMWRGSVTPDEVKGLVRFAPPSQPEAVTEEVGQMLDELEQLTANYIRNGISPDCDLDTLHNDMLQILSYPIWYQHGGDRLLQEKVGVQEVTFEFSQQDRADGQLHIRSSFEFVDSGTGPLFRLNIVRNDGDPVGWTARYTSEIINDLRFDDMRGEKMSASEVAKLESFVRDEVRLVQEFGLSALEQLAKPHSPYSTDDLTEMMMWWVFWRSPMQKALRERAVNRDTTVELKYADGKLLLTLMRAAKPPHSSDYSEGFTDWVHIYLAHPQPGLITIEAARDESGDLSRVAVRCGKAEWKWTVVQANTIGQFLGSSVCGPDSPHWRTHPDHMAALLQAATRMLQVCNEIYRPERDGTTRPTKSPGNVPARDDTALLHQIAQHMLGNKSSSKATADYLDQIVGRANWRYDPRQQVWLVRNAQGVFGAVQRQHGLLDLSQSELAAWWQRLAAAGGSQAQLPLFGIVLRYLGDEKHLREYARLVEEAARTEGMSFAEHLRDLLPRAKALSRRMHGAHKFKWDKSFSELSARTAAERPQTLVQDLLQTARLPYESGDCWFEWEHQPEEGALGDSGVWGALVAPVADYNGVFRAMVADIHGDFLPSTLLFDFRNPLADPLGCAGPRAIRGVREVLGETYVARWDKGERRSLQELARHAVIDHGGPLYGRTVGTVIDHMSEEREDSAWLKRHFRDSVLTIGGMFREFLSGWALAVTHIDDEPLVATTTVTSKPFYGGRGKFHPSYEYKHIVWRRPQELPKLLRRIRRIVRSGVMRYTDVSGHWVHRRAATKDCSIHPRACIRAQWRSTKRPEGLWGHDDPPVAEHDYQKCIHCTRPRWWCKDHGRGDPQHGIIEKSYEITASTGRKRRPPPLPAPLDPPPDPSLVTAEPVDD